MDCLTKRLSVSIVLPVYNDQLALSRCLLNLDNQTYDKSLFEVIVVDNNSSPHIYIDKSLNLNLKLLVCEKPGSYAARNIGLQSAQNEIIAFTDADCVPNKNWLSNAVSNLINHECDSILGGAIHVVPLNHGNPTFVESYDIALGHRQERYISLGNFAATANMITWRSNFEEVGLFNDELKSGGDYEWGNRAILKNKALIYCPDVIVSHPARNKLSEIITKARRVKGGIFKLRKSDSIALITKAGIAGTPINSLVSIFSNERIPKLSHKLGVIVISLIVFLVIKAESLRLSLGFESERM